MRARDKGNMTMGQQDNARGGICVPVIVAMHSRTNSQRGDSYNAWNENVIGQKIKKRMSQGQP